MHTKWSIIFLGLVSLFLIIVISLSMSYVFNGFANKKWVIWQAFIYPALVWIIIYPLFCLYWKIIKKNNSSQKLASSNFMNKAVFRKKFNHYSDKDVYKASWVTKTYLTKGKRMSFYQAKQEGHALVIGSTGSGKTSLLLDANIQLFARSTDQPTMIITDPKGELFRNHSQLLKKSGYEVLSINLRNHKKSSHWNPLERIWDSWFKNESDEFSKEESLNHLSELATTLFPPQKGGGDTFFEESAASVFQFFVIAYLEKAETNDEYSKEYFNLTNIISNIHQTSFYELQKLIDDLPEYSRALIVGGSNLKGSDKTVASTLQTCVTRLRIYTDPVIKRVTGDTNIEIDIKKPQAIFVIVPDESKAKYPFISLFISEMYKELIALATQSRYSRLKRRFYFLLDEFGNIPKIPGMDSMITVARSRNIFFMLLLQNYSQLNEKYSNNVANTIISNCAYEFFLLTSDVDTAKKFSQKLGQKSLMTTSRSNSSNQKGSSSSSSRSERTRQLVHPDELMKLQFGEFILSMQREDPIKSSLAMLRKWSGFVRGEIKIEQKSLENFNDKHLKNFVKPEKDFPGFDQFEEIVAAEQITE